MKSISLRIDDAVYYHSFYDWEVDTYVQDDGLECKGEDFITFGRYRRVDEIVQVDEIVGVEEIIYGIGRAENVTLDLICSDATITYEFDNDQIVIFQEIFDYLDGILLPEDIGVFSTEPDIDN